MKTGINIDALVTLLVGIMIGTNFGFILAGIFAGTDDACD